MNDSASNMNILFRYHMYYFAASAPDSLTAVCPVEKRREEKRDVLLSVASLKSPSPGF